MELRFLFPHLLNLLYPKRLSFEFAPTFILLQITVNLAYIFHVKYDVSFSFLSSHHHISCFWVPPGSCWYLMNFNPWCSAGLLCAARPAGGALFTGYTLPLPGSGSSRWRWPLPDWGGLFLLSFSWTSAWAAGMFFFFLQLIFVWWLSCLVFTVSISFRIYLRFFQGRVKIPDPTFTCGLVWSSSLLFLLFWPKLTSYFSLWKLIIMCSTGFG